MLSGRDRGPATLSSIPERAPLLNSDACAPEHVREVHPAPTPALSPRPARKSCNGVRKMDLWWSKSTGRCRERMGRSISVTYLYGLGRRRPRFLHTAFQRPIHIRPEGTFVNRRVGIAEPATRMAGWVLVAVRSRTIARAGVSHWCEACEAVHSCISRETARQEGPQCCAVDLLSSNCSW